MAAGSDGKRSRDAKDIGQCGPAVIQATAEMYGI
jgi:hypothetical protein